MRTSWSPVSGRAPVELPVKYTHFMGLRPQRAHSTDAGFDLCSAESGTVQPGQHAQFDLGVAVAIPEGCVGLVFSRSGMGFKHHITLSNSVGVIDHGYAGSFRVSLFNAGNTPYGISAGDRVAQLVIVPLQSISGIEEVAELPASDRGERGFGSTGN